MVHFWLRSLQYLWSANNYNHGDVDERTYTVLMWKKIREVQNVRPKILLRLPAWDLFLSPDAPEPKLEFFLALTRYMSSWTERKLALKVESCQYWAQMFAEQPPHVQTKARSIDQQNSNLEIVFFIHQLWDLWDFEKKWFIFKSIDWDSVSQNC